MPRTKGLKDYPSELKDKIVKEREAGVSLRQIARKYNVSVYSVGAWCGQVSRVNARMQMPLKRGRPTNNPEEIEKIFNFIPGVQDSVVYEGKSRRGDMYNAIVAEIFPDYDYMKKNGVEDVEKYLQEYVNKYNKTAVPYKKIAILKVRTEEFPKNTLRKILRFKLDMSID